MLRRIEPEVGAWYEDSDRQALFEIVSFDEDTESIGIQYYDGEIEELDVDTFVRLPLVPVEQPEDWSGPFEMDHTDRDESDFSGAQEEQVRMQSLTNETFESSELQILDEF